MSLLIARIHVEYDHYEWIMVTSSEGISTASGITAVPLLLLLDDDELLLLDDDDDELLLLNDAGELMFVESLSASADASSYVR